MEKSIVRNRAEYCK